MHRILFTALAALAVFGCSPKVDQAEALDFGTCHAVAIALAKNPSSAQIPHVRPWTDGKGRVEYSWRHGDGLAFANGFGALIDTRLSCVLQDGVLHTVLIDGTQVHGERFNALARAAERYRERSQRQP